MKKVSIILVNYNGIIDTDECIKSLRKITYRFYDIIVVDNGSTTDYSKLCEKYNKSDVIVLNSRGNLGFSGGNNVGIRYAIENGADYILLLNNDTYVEPDFLDYMVYTAEKKNNQCAVTCKIMYAYKKNIIWYGGGRIDLKTSRTAAFGINQEDRDEFNEIKEVNFASGCCMLLPINLIKTVGLLREDYFLYCEDTDYSLRILDAGFKIIYEPNSKIYHKVNASTNKIAGIQAYYLVRNKLYIVKRFIKRRYKIIAYVYVLSETIKRIFMGEYEIKSVKDALRDFKKQINGKI